LKILALCIADWYEVTFCPNLKYNFSVVNIIIDLLDVAEMDNLNCIIFNFIKWLDFLSMSSICYKGVGDIYMYEGESIIIRDVCFIFIKIRVEILQLHNFST
jgi:hypothetical protein